MLFHSSVNGWVHVICCGLPLTDSVKRHGVLRYPSVGLLKLTVDLLSMGGDVRVSGFLNALGIDGDVRPTLGDPSFNRLYNAVATIVKLLDRAGLVAYNSAMGVVDVPRRVGG